MASEQVRSGRRPLLLGILLVLVLAGGGSLFYQQDATVGRLAAQITQLRADVTKAEKAAASAISEATSATARAAKAEEEAKRARTAATTAMSARDGAIKAHERAEASAKSAREAASKLTAERDAAKAEIAKLKTRIATREATQSRVERLVAMFLPQMERLTKSDISVDGVRGHDAEGNVLENGLVLMNLSIRPKSATGGGAKVDAPIRVKRVTIRRYDFAQPARPRFLEVAATGIAIPVARLQGPVKRALEKAGVSMLVGKIRYDAYHDSATKVAAVRLLEIDIDGFGKLSLSLSYATTGERGTSPTDLSNFTRFNSARASLRSLTLEIVNREGYQVLLKGIAALEGTSEGLLVRNLTEAIVKARGTAEQQKFTLLADLYDAALTFMKLRGGLRIIVAPTKPVSLAELIQIARKDPAALKARLNATIEALPRPY